MKRNEPIRSVLTTDVVTIQLGEAPSKARRILATNRFHHLPVLDGRRVVGILSSVDIMRAGLSTWGNDARAIDAMLDASFEIQYLMKPEPDVVSVTVTVRQAAEALAHGDYHAVPVVDDDGNLVGIVTSTDLIRYLLDQY